MKPERVDVEFWTTSIVVTATPGTGALFTVAAGLNRGVRAGIVAALGCTLGIVPHLVLASSGAAAVLVAAGPFAFEVLTWLGVGYLLVMAWGSWRQTGVLAPEPDERSPTSASRTIGTAILVNLLNPKLTLFFFVFLPMFVDPRATGAALHMAGLGAAFMGVTLVIFVGYGVCAASLRRYVIGKPVVLRRADRVFALLFIAMAVVLAAARQ